MTMIRVIAVVVDTKRLQIYKEDGRTIDIMQGDPRLAPIVEAAEPLANPVAFKLPKNANGSYYIDIDVPERDTPKDTSIADYEKKAGGFTKFFRVVKSKVAHLLGFEDDAPAVAPQTLGDTRVYQPAPTPLPTDMVKDSTGITVGGTVEKPFTMEGKKPIEGITGATMSPQAKAPEPEPVKEDDSRKDPKISKAISDIMAHAEPVSDPNFDMADTKEDETIIAVVDDGTGNAGIVPDVQNLKNHMVAAAKSGNTKGMQAFLARLAKAGRKRNHTVEELMRFMERGDLPLADDGSIIAYKVLRSTKKDGSKLAPGTYVDCHSGKVEQRVGSYVCQSESIIDQSRAQCSTGLHIARRAYLRGFSGDIITMVKIAPEDVVAVPPREPDKMRVCGYHIIGLVPRDEHARLRSNEEMKGTNALKLLSMAIAGEHIDIIERVEITAAYGGSFTITPVEGAHGKRPQLKKETVPTAPVQHIPAPEAPKLDAAPVDPKAAAKKVTEVKKLTAAEHARELFTTGKMAELIAYKKKAKKSYSALGFTPSEEDAILGSQPKAEAPATKPGQMTKAEVAKQEKAVSAAAPVVEAVSEKDEPAPKAKSGTAAKAKSAPTDNERVKPKMEGTRAEVARQLFDKAAGGDKASWGHLWLHRKECKKSWEILGFTPKEIERIKTNKPDWV